MKIRVAYERDQDMEEGTGICVMEGKVTKSSLSGWCSAAGWNRHGAADISLVIMSRIRRRDRETKELQNRLLRDFACWFSYELPEYLPFICARRRGSRKRSTELAGPSSLLKGCWQDLLEGVLGDLTDPGKPKGCGKMPMDFAVLLFWEEQYFFCGGGGIYIQEYNSSRGVSQWITCEERCEFAREFGETEEIYFKIRKVREHSLFILSPEPFSPEISKKFVKRILGKGIRKGMKWWDVCKGKIWITISS